MSIFDLFKAKKDTAPEFDVTPYYLLDEDEQIEYLNKKFDVVYTPPPVDGCQYCGNKSYLSDRRGGCISCGAPLPKITKQTELSYYWTT